MKKILWIDNDRIFTQAHEPSLDNDGFEVIRAYGLSEAWEILKAQTDLSLVILDVMMNVKAEEEKDYPPSETDDGRQAGLVFYRKRKAHFENHGIPVLVLTVREDNQIIKDFNDEGLPESNFMTKREASNVKNLLERVNKLKKIKES